MSVAQMLRGLGKAARSKYEDLGALAMEEGNALLRNQDTGYFDLTNSMNVPNVPQEVPGRYVPPRGMPASLERIGADTSKRLMDTTLQGVRSGAHGWYNTDPLREEFIRVLGPVAGQHDYDKYMEFVAATSPRSSVKENIKRASIPYMREKQGKPIVGLGQPNDLSVPEDMRYPQGYGHLAHNLHQLNLDDIGMMGGMDPITKPKVSSFSMNLRGNQAPMTMDTHNRAAVFPQDVQYVYNKKKGVTEKKMKSPSKTEYGLLEQYQGELGKMLGLTPAQWQSSLWTGGAADTGVRDARNFMNMFNESIQRTAEKNGITEREAAEAFIKGEIPLAAIMGSLYDEEDEGIA